MSAGRQLAAFLYAAATAPAQTTVRGIVPGPTGRGIAGAAVELRGYQYSTGAFRFDAVSPGSFEIVVEREGFTTAVTGVRAGSCPNAFGTPAPPFFGQSVRGAARRLQASLRFRF